MSNLVLVHFYNKNSKFMNKYSILFLIDARIIVK